jgi:hypothetical protein
MADTNKSTYIFYVVTVGLVFLQIASYIAVNVFEKPAINAGPYLLTAILVGIIYISMGVVNRFIIGDPTLSSKMGVGRFLLTMGIAFVILLLLYIYLPGITPQFFEASMVPLRP